MNHIKSSLLEVSYRFRRADGVTHEMSVKIDPETMRSMIPEDAPQPEWLKLDFHACAGCRWQESDRCPVAERLAKPISVFSDVISYETVEMEVETEDRSYHKPVDMQQGISSLFGLLMATSGCPSLSGFRPMARYHLPFSSFDETFFRVTGAVLMQQLFEGNQSINRETTIERLNVLYDDAAKVNVGIMERLRRGFATQKDSSPNAVALLSSFSGLATMLADKKLREVEALFKK